LRLVKAAINQHLGGSFAIFLYTADLSAYGDFWKSANNITGKSLWLALSHTVLELVFLLLHGCLD
jgi:hypothetical protein